MDRGGDDLVEVVRSHVGGHAHRDAGGTVDEQVGEGGGEDGRLLELTVVVGHEVHDVLVEVLRESERGRSQARFRVPRRRGSVVERTEVAVTVDQRHPQRERLSEAHERVVDRRVAVRVQLSHHFADDARTLDVPSVGPKTHVRHLEQNAPLHGLRPSRASERARE